MSLKAWFHRVGEYDFIAARCKFLDTELARVEHKLALAETALTKERASKDKFVLKSMDQLSRQAKLPAVFDEKPKEPSQPVFTKPEEYRIESMAMVMRDADLQVKDDVPPLADYIEKLKESGDPDSFLLN